VEAKAPSRLLGRTAQQVAQAGYDGFMARKRVVIPGFGNKVMSFLPRVLPRGLMLRTIESYQRGRGRRAENRKKRPKF
jgi:short-subunit dehydrogenase